MNKEIDRSRLAERPSFISSLLNLREQEPPICRAGKTGAAAGWNGHQPSSDQAENFIGSQLKGPQPDTADSHGESRTRRSGFWSSGHDYSRPRIIQRGKKPEAEKSQARLVTHSDCWIAVNRREPAARGSGIAPPPNCPVDRQRHHQQEPDAQ